jgi:diphthamide biosynthesis protein 7
MKQKGKIPVFGIPILNRGDLLERLVKSLDYPIAKFPVGGGVWRIKWHPSSVGKMLVAAMHGGCRVVNIRALDSTNTDVQADVEVLSEFSAHDSMAYGADWLCFDPFCDEVAASCSFYDRKAFVWDPYNQPK